MTEIEQQHLSDLRAVQEQVKFFYSQKRKVKIYHGSTTSTRTQKFEKGKFVDVSRLDRIVEINSAGPYVLVEPNVPMDKLVEATLRYGLVPPVVPELPLITVGGSIQGGAGESSSFKYGGVHDCCLEYEVVLGNGEIITASPTQNKDLFYGIACSYGSLGIITLVKLSLVPAKDFVRLKYFIVGGFDEAVGLIEENVGEAVDFIDGIIFTKNRGVVMIGNFTDKNDLPVSTFSKRSDEWFYLHADEISRRHDAYEEIIPIKDYLFRYDRGVFWLGRQALSFFKIPFTRLTRFLLDRALKSRTLSLVGQATSTSQKYFVQDLCLPKENFLNFLQFVDEELHIYPLWLVPLRPAGSLDKLSPNYILTDLVINAGVWGKIKGDYFNVNRKVEGKLRELKGRKVLYAHAYYPRDEFWKIYDHSWYSQLREKYFASSVFPDLYDKTHVSEKYQPSVLSGIWKVLRSSKLSVP